MSYIGPGIYEHFRGKKYRIEGLAWDETARYRMVIYRPTDWQSNDEELSISFWIRNLENFNEEIDGKQRFTLIERLQ